MDNGIELSRWIIQNVKERIDDHELDQLIEDLEDIRFKREIRKEEESMTKHQLNIDEAVRIVGNRRDNAAKKKVKLEELDEIQKENYERFEQDLVEDINQEDHG